MSLKRSANCGVGDNGATTNRLLILYSIPIFAYWTSTAVAVLHAWIAGPTHHPAILSLLSILYLFSPLCVSLGWVLLAKRKLRFQDPRLKVGRRSLIIASFLALPIVVSTICWFGVLFLKPGHLFN
jgi:hypothetical protein